MPGTSTRDGTAPQVSGKTTESLEGRKDVVFVTQHYPPDKGGNATRIHDIATNLDDDWRVTVLAPPPSYPAGEFERRWHRKRTESVDGVWVHRLWSWQPQQENPGMPQRLAYYLLFGIHAMLWLLWNVRRYDVIVTTTPPISTGAPGLLASLLGKPWVVDVRDRWIDASISLGYLEEGSLIERLSRRFQRLVLHTADRITVTTPLLEEALCETYGASLGEKTMVLPNGVDVTRFRDDDEQPDGRRGEDRRQSERNPSRGLQVANGGPVVEDATADTRRAHATRPEERGSVAHGPVTETSSDGPKVSSDGPKASSNSPKASSDGPTIIYTGNLGSAQDLESVIRAMPSLSHDGATLRLVGGGDVESELRQLTEEIGIHDRVEFVGVVPREGVPPLLDQATLGIAPLKDTDELAYAMPTKVYEYMASGLPAVVTGRGEIEQFVNESGGGVHVPNDPERIAQRLDGLLEDDRYRQQLARRGQSYVERNFDRKTIARRFGNELTSLVEGGRAQSCGWP